MAVAKGLSGFSTYAFSGEIETNSSISTFWFEVDEGDGSTPTVLVNDGDGLPIDQAILYDPSRTSFFDPNGEHLLNVVAAVSNSHWEA